MNADDHSTSGGETKGGSAAAKPLETLIAELPLLKGLSSKHFRTLTDNAMQSQFKAGELIFREGDPANRFYLIQHGQVALESSPKDRPAVRIQTTGAGDVLGWSWLFPPYYWHFDARALEPTSAISFCLGHPRAARQRLMILNRHPDGASGFPLSRLVGFP